MTKYRVIWAVGVVLLTVAGMAVDLDLGDVDTTVGIFLMSAAVAGSIHLNRAWPQRKPGQPVVVPTAIVATSLAAITVALWGYWAFVGPDTIGLGLAGVLTCPPVLTWLTAHRG